MNRTIRFLALLISVTAFSCSSRGPQADGPVSAVDDLGRTISLKGPAQRIVSLAPSITETLFALGLDSAIVGVTDYCDYPPQAAHRAHVGGMLNPAIEKIVSLRPDLVLMSGSGNVQADFARLSDLGLTVFVSYPRTLTEIYKSITDIGTLCGRQAQAESITDSLEVEANRVQDRALRDRRRSVLFLVSIRPLIAAGSGTFLDEMIRLCNATNIAAEAPTAYPMINREKVLSADPDCIVVTSDAVKSRSELFAAFSEWKHLRAVTDSALALINADIVTRPGPRIAQGMAALCRAIHGPAEQALTK